jgi:hypothetical protein
LTTLKKQNYLPCLDLCQFIAAYAEHDTVHGFRKAINSEAIKRFVAMAGGLATIGVAIIPSPILLSFILLMQATFCVVFFPVGIVAIAKVTLPQERGVFTGVIMGISGLTAIGATPFLPGAIADIASFQVGFILLGALTLAICPVAFTIGKI